MAVSDANGIIILQMMLGDNSLRQLGAIHTR
jgi:hypothetical protein